MSVRPDKGLRRGARRLLAGSVLAAGVLAASSVPAHAAVNSTFSSGVLTVSGDSLNNSIAISRNAAGTILVNGGAVATSGGTPTVANTSQIRVLGLDGQDTIALSEVNGALPKANLFGGSGNDVLTGGSGGDQLFGQAGTDTLLGKGGADLLFGGSENDTLTGGDADDQSFGQGGNDRMVWNPGDDTDLNEGGEATDTVEVNGGNGAEQFTTTANGARVRFDRVTPAPFAIDIGTSEKLVLNANGGDDSFSATGNLAALIAITVDGGAGNDTLLGSNGVDVLLGGNGNDFADGQQGNDVESIVAKTLGGADNVVVNDLSGTDVVDVRADLAAIGGDDAQPDNVITNATNGDDVVSVTGLGPNALLSGLAAQVSVSGAIAGSDRVTVNALAGDDVVDATGLAADSALLTADGGDGDDVLLGGDGNDTLLGGAGDDVLIGGPGNDTTDGGLGDNVVLGVANTDAVSSATVAGTGWLKAHARTVRGKTVLKVSGKKRTLPRADLAPLARQAASS